MEGVYHVAAIPEATLARFCSATPTTINRSGNAFLKRIICVDSVRSAQRPTTFSFCLPASRKPSPKPFRIASCSTSFSNTFGFNLLMLTFDLPSESAQLGQSHFGLFLVRRFTVPMKVAFAFFDAFTGDRMRNNQGWFFKNALGLVDRADDLSEIVSADFLDVPIPGFPSIAQPLQWHHVFREPVDLDVIPIDYRDQISQFFFSRQHGRFPTLSFIQLAVAHQAVDVARAASTSIDSVCQCHSNRLRKAGAKRTGAGLQHRQKLAMWMTLQTRPKFPQRLQLIDWEISGISHCRIKDRTDMAVGKN